MSPTEQCQMTSSAIGGWLGSILPGLGLTFGIALVATAVQKFSGMAALSPLVVAMVLGIIARNLIGTPVAARPGIGFTLRRVLRFAIVLLGFQLTLAQLRAVGVPGLAVISATLAATFVFTKWAGRLLGVERRLAELIAAGTSVCGASAVIATNTVTRGADEDVAYAIACVTVFGSLSMIAMPVLGEMLAMAPAHYGIWVGATVHEVAQVVGAGFQHSAEAGQAATVAKLSRVMLLAPLILVLGMLARRNGHAAQGSAPTPWFVLGFLALVLVRTTGIVPPEVVGGAKVVQTVLLAMAMFALGCGVRLTQVRTMGIRPVVLAAASTVIVATTGLAGVLLVS